MGWCSELARGNKPMLQYHLIAVYSEYMACDETHEDVLHCLLPRFAKLASSENPWSAAGIKFVLTGAQGDLKWINEKYGLHPYNRNECCSRCDAVKNHEDVCKTIACFTEAATFVEKTHEQWCDEHALEDWPLPMTAGVRLERFMHDVAHSQLLGTGKIHNGSCLIYLAESGEFNAANCFPEHGEYTANLQVQLRAAYNDFKRWAKAAKLQVNQPRFTYARCNRKNRSSHACLASKAVSGKVISFWLAARCTERADPL